MTADLRQQTDPPMVPPVLYVPRSNDDDPVMVSLDYRTMRDGRIALMAYTALDRLVGCCGDRQPWVLIETSALDDIDDRQPYDVILLDVDIPAEHRRGVVAP